MRAYILTPLVFALALFAGSPAHAQVAKPADELVKAVDQIRRLTHCTREHPPAPDTDLGRLCNFLVLFDSATTDSGPRVGLRARGATLLIKAFDAYLSNAPPGEVRRRAAAILSQLNAGGAPDLPELALVPTEICRQAGLEARYCSVPDCLIGDSHAVGSARCAATPKPTINQAALRAAIAAWRKANPQTEPCPDTTSLCLPVDPEAAALRDYIIASGFASLRTSLQASASTGDASAVRDAVSSELQCWVNRDAATRAASSVEEAFGSDSARVATIKGAFDQALDLKNKVRAIQVRCVQADTDRLYRTSAQLLQNALVPALKEQLLEESARRSSPSRDGAMQPGGSPCDQLPVRPEERFDFPVAKSGPVKTLRLRGLGGADGLMQLSLVMRDRLVQPPTPATPCGRDEYEVVLGVSSYVEWSSRFPHLGGPFARPAFSVDTAQLAKAIGSIIPIQGVDLTLDAKVRSGIVPVTLTGTLRLPGVPVTLEMPSIEIDPNAADYGLSALVDPARFRSELNDALARHFSQPVTIPSLGFAIRSLKWISPAGDSGAPYFGAVASIRALEPIVPEIPVELYLAPTGKVDQSNRMILRITLRPSSLPASVVRHLAAKISDQINTWLAGIAGAQQFGRLDTLRMTVASLTEKGIALDATLHFPDTALEALPIHLELTPGDADLDGQLRRQLGAIASSVTNALAAYIRQRVAQAAAPIVKSALDELRAHLPQSLPLFGTTWSVTNIDIDDRDVHGLCFDLVRDSTSVAQVERRWAIQKVCARALAANGVPRFIWDRATLSPGLVESIGQEVAALSRAPYFTVKLVDAELKDDSLVGHITVTLLDWGTPIPAEVTLGSTGANVKIERGIIESVVLTAIRPPLRRALEGKELPFGEFSLSGFEIPDSGNVLSVTGHFHNGNWLSGTLTADVYPTFNLHDPKPTLEGALKQLIGFATDTDVIDITEVLTNPLVVRGTVKLANIPLLSDAGMPLPIITLEVPLRGSPRIFEPVGFGIPGVEIPIPPFFSLTNPALEIYPVTQPMKFQGSADLTVVSGPMANIIKVHSVLTADLKTMRFEFQGPLTVLRTLELARSEGVLDAAKAVANMRTGTSGFFAQIVPADMSSTLDGSKCRFTQSVSGAVNLLNIDVRGDLALQAPCGGDHEDCPPRGLGSACIKGSVNLGPLGDAEGQLGATLDFEAPVASVRVSTLNLLFWRPSIDVRVASEFARASFTAGPFDVTVATASVSDITPKLLEDLLREALEMHISLDALFNHHIVLNLLPPAKSEDDPQSDLRQAQTNASAQSGARAEANNKDDADALAQAQAEAAAQSHSKPHIQGDGASGGRAANAGAKSTAQQGGARAAGTGATGAAQGGSATAAGGGVPPPANAASNPPPAPGGGVARAFPPGDWSIQFTDRENQKTGPLVWRHLIASNPTRDEPSAWLINPEVVAAMTSANMLTYSSTFTSPTIRRPPDALSQSPPPTPQQQEYQLLFREREGNAAPQCLTGICTAVLDISNPKIIDVAGEQLLRPLFGLQTGPLGPYVLGKPELLDDRARYRALRDLVIAAWEDEPKVSSVQCLDTGQGGCAGFLLEGARRSSRGTTVKQWIHTAGHTWEIEPDSLLAAATAAEWPEPVRRAALGKSSPIIPVARTDSHVLVLYDDPQSPDVWIAVWDAGTLKESVRVHSSPWLYGKSMDEPIDRVGQGTFAAELISRLLRLKDPVHARLQLNLTHTASSYLLRERLAEGESLTDLTVIREGATPQSQLRDNRFCIRSGTTQSVLAAAAARKLVAEVPATTPAEPERIFDYLLTVIGRDSETWRARGFLVNPAVLLDITNRSPGGQCLQ